MNRRLHLMVVCALFGVSIAIAADAPKPDFSQVPGVVIDYSPAASGKYVGSPSIAILPDGAYLASHDWFGPGSTEHKAAVSAVFRSDDRGKTWRHMADIDGAFWSNLFVHKGAVYLLGPTHHHGNLVIRCSTDGGATWTSPTDKEHGLLREGQFHCAPVPVVIHDGRIWRAIEDAGGGNDWGKRYRAMMLSVPVDADLLKAESWTTSSFVQRDPAWLDGKFYAWLEGNAVVAPSGKMVDILRCEVRGPLPVTEQAAIVNVSDDGKTASFDPTSGFVQFPGGAKKFTIRFDENSKLYWSLSNYIPPKYQGVTGPGALRNTLALMSSADLRNWTVNCVVLHHPDRAKHAFQYVDWLFDGDDIIVASRTAYDDGVGGAQNAHDANFLTFHRVAGFRTLTMKDGIQVPGPGQTVVHEDDELAFIGDRFEIAPFGNEQPAFGNRPYVWKDVPAKFEGWRFTRVSGGVEATLRVKAKRDVTVYAATTLQQKAVDLGGWEPVEGGTFWYSDKGRTKMNVYQRKLAANETLVIPQTNWAGMLVLLPGK